MSMPKLAAADISDAFEHMFYVCGNPRFSRWTKPPDFIKQAISAAFLDMTHADEESFPEELNLNSGMFGTSVKYKCTACRLGTNDKGLSLFLQLQNVQAPTVVFEFRQNMPDLPPESLYPKDAEEESDPEKNPKKKPAAKSPAKKRRAPAAESPAKKKPAAAPPKELKPPDPEDVS